MIKPWLQTYDKNIPSEIDADAYPSIVALFKNAVTHYDDLPALECFGQTVNYTDIDTAAESVAAWLQKRLGVKRGDWIALMCPNTFAFPIACMASSARAQHR